MATDIHDALRVAGEQSLPIDIQIGDSIPYARSFVRGDWLYIEDFANREFSGCRMNIRTLEFDAVVSRHPYVKVFRAIFEGMGQVAGHIQIHALPITIEIGEKNTRSWVTRAIYEANVISSVDGKKHFLIGIELLSSGQIKQVS